MIYIGITVAILAIDLGIKYYVEHHRTHQQEDRILGDAILVRKSHNKGIALNALDRHPLLVRGISVGMTALMAIVALYLLFKKDSAPTSKGKKLGLAWLLGGALSNTYDRVFRGYVVDYFSFNVKWKKLRRVVFNIADLFIIVGSVIFSCFGASDASASRTVKKH
ncbi:MAG TPA: signal peptidase II [Lachnospiraceae bacterium]|jgi:signal peptidase II|nr:signal peptidase II [Lachnospiraceae bacterium]